MALVRQPAVAGTFYPGAVDALCSQVDRLLSEAGEVAGPPELRALIVPHAGYVYSGPIAARAYAALRAIASSVTRVALFGPAHFVAVAGLALPAAEAFDTPLGRVPLDADGMRRCLELPQVTTSAAAHVREHSLEVQLPFLQRLLPGGFELLPFCVGRAGPADVAAVMDLVADERTLVLVSSDLSHYLPYHDACATDRATAEQIVRLGAVEHEDACGSRAVNGALAWARERRLRAQLLDLRNSGDTAGGRDQVVGYGAFALSAGGGGRA